jgi:hypothetical protein
MGVFSGRIPILQIGNSQVGTFASSALGGALDIGLGVAVNQVLGANVATRLGLNPAGSSNFLGSILSPGLIDTGVTGLSQVIGTSISNSNALGPLGPIAGGLAQSIVSNLGSDLINSLFGKPLAGGAPSVYFPGAGGEAEGEGQANYGGAPDKGGILQGNQAYTLGTGGPDVVFSITSATASVRKEDVTASELMEEFGGGLEEEDDLSFLDDAPSEGTAAAATAAASVNPSSTFSAQGFSYGNFTSPSYLEGASFTGSVSPYDISLSGTGNLGSKFISSSENWSIAGTETYFGSVGAGAFDAYSVSSTPASGTANVGTGTQSAAATGGVAVASTGAVAEGTTTPPATSEQPPEDKGVVWKFICAPEEISWETTMQADRVQIFGANQAPVISGVKGMRDLTLNNAVVEGFSRGKTVEDKIIMLESMLDMTLDTQKKYVQVPVYRVSANSKIYGQGLSDGGFFIIKSIKIQEKMRDLSGVTTRAMVDISLIQVPPYQVDSGRDIASSFLASSKAPFTQISENVAAQTKTSVNTQGSQGTSKGGGSGSDSGGAPPAAAPSSQPTARRPGAGGRGLGRTAGP